MRKTSKRKTHRSAPMPEPPTEQTVKAESPSTPATEPASRQPDPTRVAFSLKEDGTLDDEGIRAVTREKLRRVFSDPKLGEKLGIEQPSASSDLRIPLAFFEKAADLIHDTIGKLAVVAVAKQGYPIDEARGMLLTAEDKAILNPLAAKALDDWCPAIEGKYQSLALLGAGYLSIFGAKFAALKKPADVIPFSRPAAVPTPEPTATPEREP